MTVPSTERQAHGIDVDWGYEAIRCTCGAPFVENDTEALSLHLQDTAREAAETRAGVLQGQLDKARARHQPVEIFLEFHEVPVQSSKRTVCSGCSDLESDFGIISVPWPCEEAVALGLDGGGSE